MFPVRHCPIPDNADVYRWGPGTHTKPSVFWFVVITTIFRKPGVGFSASQNHGLLNSFVPEKPLFSQSLHTRLVSSCWFPMSCHIGSRCFLSLMPFFWPLGFALAQLAHFPQVIKTADCDLLSTRNLECGNHWPFLPLYLLPHLAHSRHLIKAYGMSPWMRNREQAQLWPRSSTFWWLSCPSMAPLALG